MATKNIVPRGNLEGNLGTEQKRWSGAFVENLDVSGNTKLTFANGTITDVATQAEAEAGTDNTKVMTSLRTKEAIDAQRKVKVYRNVQELGFDPSTVTISELLLTLPISDALTTVVDTNTFCPNIDVPEVSGTLYITKAYSSGYVEMRFIGSSGSWYWSVGRSWNGGYDAWKKCGSFSPANKAIAVSLSFVDNYAVYQPPADGYFCIGGHNTKNPYACLVNNASNGITTGNTLYNNTINHSHGYYVPVKKGDTVSVYAYEFAVTKAIFVYAQSEV